MQETAFWVYDISQKKKDSGTNGKAIEYGKIFTDRTKNGIKYQRSHIYIKEVVQKITYTR